MKLRVGLGVLTALVVTACGQGSREIAVQETPQAQPASDQRHGTLILGGKPYPFAVQTCAIGGGGGDFMIVGSGADANGENYRINADGSAAGVSVVLRKQSQLRLANEVFRAKFSPRDVQVEDRTVTGKGQFEQAGSRAPLAGELSVSCG